MPKIWLNPRARAACQAKGAAGKVCGVWSGNAKPVWVPHAGQKRPGWVATKPQWEHCTIESSVVQNRSNEREAVSNPYFNPEPDLPGGLAFAAFKAGYGCSARRQICARAGGERDPLPRLRIVSRTGELPTGA